MKTELQDRAIYLWDKYLVEDNRERGYDINKALSYMSELTRVHKILKKRLIAYLYLLHGIFIK